MNAISNFLIEPFKDGDGPDFARLNREWLVGYNLFEPLDEIELSDPVGTYIANGGAIWVARRDGEAIGTCAVLSVGPKALEIVKLAVASSVQRQGIGRSLIRTCINYALSKECTRLVLVSNSNLKAALALYESLGFRYQPLPPGQKYVTADVYMELEL